MPPAGKRGARPSPQLLESRILLSISGTWKGQDGHDLVGPSAHPGPSDVQDIRIRLDGLPAEREVTFVDVQGLGGGRWQFNGRSGVWAAALVREPGAVVADLFLEPYQRETGRPFLIAIHFDDGSTTQFWVQGGAADPNRRMPQASLRVSWVGQDGHDHVGPGPAVGPDGQQDARLSLSRLSADVAIRAVFLDGPLGAEWQYGLNRQARANAELVRDPGDPTRAELFIQPDRNLNGQELTVTVVYANGTTDSATVVAGPTDPSRAMPAPEPFPLRWNTVTAVWMGQDGSPPGRRGDVRVKLDGLPEHRAVVAAALSDPVTRTWVYQSDTATGSIPFHVDPEAHPLTFQRSTTDPTQADLSFPPYRDASGDRLTLRLVFDDGTTVVTRFDSGPVDLALRSGQPAASVVEARPGADLHDLVQRFGTIRLAAGVYHLDRPLELAEPVTITAGPGAVLRFAQDAADAPWTAAIKIHAGNTTLEGFAVRFQGPIRWKAGVDYGPAVIGTTDNFDTGHRDPRAGIVLAKLDLEGPPVEGALQEAPRLIRMATALGGRIEGNTLKGGSTVLLGGPWQVLHNDYRGTTPGTFTFDAFAVHHAHDVLVQGNTVEPVGPSGKTWRFLVLTGRGANVTVRDNTVRGIGPRDDDTIPSFNAAETILTEAYRLHFEGRPSRISTNGRVLQIPEPQGTPARTGAIVAILTGPHAGTWRRVAQVIDPQTYLMDQPLPPGDYAISISTGFVHLSITGNTIDARGSSVAAPLVLAGNHFNTRVSHNHFLGGGEAFRITAAPTEQPVLWGWSRSPFFGGVIRGNTIEDALRGATLSVEHGSAMKATKGRVYLTAELSNNVFRWTQEFLDAWADARRAGQPRAITIGNLGSLDPGELILSATNNRVQGPAGYMPGATMHVVSATLNGAELVAQRLILPTVPPPAPRGLALVHDTGRSASDWITADARIRFDAAPGAVGYEYRLDGSTTAWPIGDATTFRPHNLVQGTNVIWVRAYDATGHRGRESRLTFVYDTVPPRPTAPALATGQDTGRSAHDNVTRIASPRFEVSADDRDEVLLLRDGAVVARRIGPGTLQEPQRLADGAYTYRVRLIDLAGNAALGPSLRVTIDTTPPARVSGLTRLDDGRVRFDPTDPEDHYEYRVGATGPYTPLGSHTVFAPEGLQLGTNVVYVRAVDVAGNIGRAGSLRIDVPPRPPSGLWRGQDGHDLVGPSSLAVPDGIQDIRITLIDLPADRTITLVDVQGLGGGRWLYNGPWGPWAAALVRAPGATSADLFLQPYQHETGRPFWMVVHFDDGSTAGLWVEGGAADPHLPMPGSEATAAPSESPFPAFPAWIGTERLAPFLPPRPRPDARPVPVPPAFGPGGPRPLRPVVPSIPARTLPRPEPPGAPPAWFADVPRPARAARPRPPIASRPPAIDAPRPFGDRPWLRFAARGGPREAHTVTPPA